MTFFPASRHPSTLVILALVCCATLAPAIRANTITVTTLDEELNGDSDCSLREAITAAETNSASDLCAAGASGSDTIVFQAGLVGSIVLGSTLPTITEALVISGDTDGDQLSREITIDGGSTHRILDVDDASLTLEDLILRDGSAGTASGGAVRSQATTATPLLTIRRTELIGNRSGDGGAIFVQNGRIDVSESRFHDNRAVNAGVGARTGGALLYDTSLSTVVTNSITSSTFTANHATSAGGAVGLRGIQTTFDLEDNFFSGNMNTDFFGGGAVFVGENTGSGMAMVVNITRCQFELNSGIVGGAIRLGFSASGSSATTIDGSSFVDNTGREDAGALYILSSGHAGTLTVRNSTFANNTGGLGAVDGNVFSGTVSAEGTGVTLDSVTIVDNQGMGSNSFGAGVVGGFDVFSGNLTLTNTIFAGNIGVVAGAQNADEIRHSGSGTFTDGDHNLIEGTTDFELGGLSGGNNVTGVDPNVAPANGLVVGASGFRGPISVRVPGAGSAAIDAGGTSLSVDQRETARPQSASDDIGSIEVAPAAPSLDLDGNDSTAPGNNYAGSFVPGSGAVPVADGDTAITSGTGLNGATLTLGSRPDGASESLGLTATGRLAAENAGILIVDYISGTGVLELVGTASVAAYIDALEAVRYDNGAGAPTVGARTISIVVRNSADSNTATSTITVAPAVSTDLRIAKADSPDPVVAGTNLTYSVTVTNDGPSASTGSTVTDILPAGLSFVSSGDCSEVGGTVTCAIGALASGVGTTVNFVVAVESNVTGSISNTATVAADDPDPNGANDSSTEITTVTTEADLAVTKTDGVTAAVPGESLTYTIVVTNDGPSDDLAVSLTDTFPGDLTCTFSSLAAGGATGNTAAGASDLAETLAMPADSSVTYTVSCDIDPAATGTLSNTATVSGSVTDPNGANDSATDDDTVLGAEADLGVTKTDGVTAAVPGDSLTYTIVVTNDGPSDDPTVSLTDTFPADLTCTFSSLAAGGATGNTAAGASDLAENLAMPADSSVTYTVACDIDPAATGTLSNTVDVSGSVTDPNAANDSATDDDTVLGAEADLAVTKTDGVTAAVPGESLTYTIVVTNDGPSDDPAVSLTDTFPGDLTCTFSSLAAGGATGNTAAGAGDLAETLAMPAASSVTYTVTCDIDPAATGTLSNTVDVSGSVTDPNAANDSATDDDTVLGAEADLAVTKTDGVTAAVPGESLTYTIVVTNDGPSDDPTVSLTDTFPADLTCTFSSLAAGGATGNTAAGASDLAENLAMPADSSVTYTVACDIDPAATGTLSNTATVSGSVTDPNGANDSATDDDTVLGAEADLGVTKTDGVTAAVPGDSLTYTIVVTNDGPSDDPTVSLTDTFPADLTCTFSSLAAGGATGNTAAGASDLAENLAMPADSSVTYTVACDIDPAATGTLSNTVDVSGSVTDPNAANDSATDDDTVLGAEADLAVTKTDGVTAAVPGESLTYTIVVTNDGPSDDPAVSLTDTFPGDLTCTFSSLAAGGATGNTAAGAGDLAETLAMPAASSVTYTVTCDIDPAATGTLSNTVDVSGSVTDPNAANDSATDDDTVLGAEADLAVTKTDGVTAAVPGESLTYTIVVTNDGPSDDPTVSLTDTFPADLTCTFSSLAAGGATGNTAAGASDLAENLAMPADSSVTYTVACDIDPAATGTLSNTVDVSGSVTDPNAANDSATDDDTVLGAEADLGVTKTDGVTAAVPGDSLTYTIVVTNDGPSDDPTVSLTDTFPADLTCTFSSLAAGGATGNTAAGASDLAENLAMPADSSVTYTVACDIDPAATGTLSNTVDVSGSVTDPNAANDSATDDDTVLGAEADLEIEIVEAADPVAPGTALDYSVTVRNLGPSSAVATRVTTVLPAGLTFASTSGCLEDPAGAPTCMLGDLAPDATANFTLATTVDLDASGMLTSTVTVESDTVDGEPGNDSASEETLVDDEPPTITEVRSVGSTTNPIAECTEIRTSIRKLEVEFSEPIRNPVGDTDPDDATNPANYLLVAAGLDRDFSTVDCAGLAGDDVAVDLTVTYSGGVSSLIPVEAVPDGPLRLVVCGSTSIRDLAGNALDGDGNGVGGDDSQRTFRLERSNRFTNGQLDCDLNGWALVSQDPAEIATDPEDVDGSSASGSIRVTPLVGTTFSIGQCAESAGGDHRLSGRIRLTGPSGVIVGVGLTCSFFGQPGCAALLGQNTTLAIFEDTGGIWEELGSSMSSPGAVSSLCSFDLGLLAGSSFDARLDDLRLDSFIFRDGFESGDVSAWSSSSP